MRYMAAVLLLVATMSAQNAPSTNKGRHLDIPAISRRAHGAVVSIVMSDKEGHPVAQGSGFLISKDGHVVTNYHVIEHGSSAVIKLPDGAFFVVDGVLATDKNRDVAIIKAHGNGFNALTLGDSDRLQVGEEVVAIGNPLSLESTVSNGIVSAIRTVEDDGGKFVQITAPISPGSSGGPLFNMSGQVVGITTSHIKGGENLNFAIPINDVKPMIAARFPKARSLPDEPEPDEKARATVPAQAENNHCDEEYDSLKRNIIGIVGVQHNNLPPAFLAQIAEHNKKCRNAVVPGQILRRERADEEARAAQAAQQAQEALERALEAQDRALKAQHEAEIAKVRGDMLTQWQQKVASDPFAPPVEGWVHVGPLNMSLYYIIVPGETNPNCHLSVDREGDPALDCLGAARRNKYSPVRIGNRWYLLKSKRIALGDYAGIIKDGGATLCLRKSGCYHVLAEVRPMPTEPPDEHDWRLRSYISGAITVEHDKSVYTGVCVDTKIGDQFNVQQTMEGDCSRLSAFQGELLTTCRADFRARACASGDEKQIGFLIILETKFWVIDFKTLSVQRTE